MSEIIKNLTASSYRGTFDVPTDETHQVSGSMQVSGDKGTIQQMDGSVTKSGAQIANFNAWQNGEDLRYNIGDVSPAVMVEAATAIAAAHASIIASLAEA